MEFACQLDSPLGPIVLTEEDGALRSLRFVGQRYFPDSLPPFVDPATRPVFEETADWLARYFSGHEPEFTPPLAPQGTPFRLAVWELLREIPCGPHFPAHPLPPGDRCRRLPDRLRRRPEPQAQPA